MDRDKVIKGLEALYEVVGKTRSLWTEPSIAVIPDAIALLKEQETMMQCIKGKCRICPHCSNCDVDDNGELKEQEAVTPKVSMSGLWYACPACGRHLTKDIDHYCARCGKAVKWK